MILILLKYYALNAKQIHKVIHVGLLSHLLLVKELKMEKKNYINIDYLLNILRIINGKNKKLIMIMMKHFIVNVDFIPFLVDSN